MIYCFDSRVRYSEVDSERKMTLPAILNYFQDCCSFQSEDMGIGIDMLNEKNCAWVLSSWQIVLGEAPDFGEKITVETWAYDFKGFFGFRNFCMRDKEGKNRAWANSVWTFLDLDTGHPCRISEKLGKLYGKTEKLEMDYADRKIKLPEELKEQEAFSVMHHHLDTNNHVNNGQYVSLAMRFVPESMNVRQMRAEYKRAAVLGDHMVPWVHIEDDTCTVALCDGEKKPYAIVAFDA